MKINEIILESNDIEANFVEDLENILYVGLANDLMHVRTKSVYKQMTDMGYQTSLNHIMNVAKTLPIVSSASVSKIELGTNNVSDMADSSEEVDDKNEDTITNIAQKKTMKDIID